jgi:membrane-bound metal-dependent hydrolase YbcI (DUF457 family)
MIYAHEAVGYLQGYVLGSRLSFIDRLLLIVGNRLPDFDVVIYIYLYLNGIDTSHRNYITHTPFLFLLLLLPALFAFKLTGRKKLERYTNILLFGSVTHLLFDSLIGPGIMWLYPFTQTHFSVVNTEYLSSSMERGWFVLLTTLEFIICASAFTVFALSTVRFLAQKLTPGSTKTAISENAP